MLFRVAEHLHMTIAELGERMTEDELIYWVAWFEYVHQQQELKHGLR